MPRACYEEDEGDCANEYMLYSDGRERSKAFLASGIQETVLLCLSVRYNLALDVVTISKP